MVWKNQYIFLKSTESLPKKLHVVQWNDALDYIWKGAHYGCANVFNKPNFYLAKTSYISWRSSIDNKSYKINVCKIILISSCLNFKHLYCICTHQLHAHIWKSGWIMELSYTPGVQINWTKAERGGDFEKISIFFFKARKAYLNFACSSVNWCW